MRSNKLPVSLVLALVVVASNLAERDVSAGYTWSNGMVVGEDPTQLPGGVSGSIDWSISGDVLTITMTNTTSAAEPNSGWVLSGMVFDATLSSESLGLVAETATAETTIIWDDGSAQWVTAGSDVNVADYWAFKGGQIDAFGDSFDFALGTVGDIDGQEQLGNGDLISGSGLNGQPDGSDYMIFSDNDPGASYRGKSPLIQNSITFTFSGAEGMTVGDVMPYFGTDGMTLVPEPASILVWGGLALAGVGLIRRRRRSRLERG